MPGTSIVSFALCPMCALSAAAATVSPAAAAPQRLPAELLAA
jgi:hypothetical protein